MGILSEIYRISSTALIIPLFVGYYIELVITWFYPVLVETTAFDDWFGEFLILFSLLLTSHLPIILLRNIGGFAKDLLFPLYWLLFVNGVLGKLLYIAKDIWGESQCLLAVAYELCLQLLTVCCYQFDSMNLPYFSDQSRQIIFTARIFELIIFTKIAYKLRNLYNKEKDSKQQFFATRKYTCSVLVLGLLAHKSSLLVITLAYLLGQSSYDFAVGVSLFTFLTAVVIVIVLPGKVNRKLMTAIAHKTAIQQTIDQKGAFLGYISQEIRTSLSNTSLGIDCLHNHLETALESQQRDLHIGELLELSRDCQVSCAAAMHTLNDLLLFDKIENNMLQLEKKETNCGEFLEDCIHPFVRQVQAAGFKSSITVDPHAAHYFLYCDELSLTQVVRNLIVNAMKFTPNGGLIKVNTTIVTNEVSEWLRVEFIDTGSGISLENQEKIFQRYVQIRPTVSQGGKGSGLGLWLASSIMKLHGGRIGVYSKGEGYGSMFYFEIPVLGVQQKRDCNIVSTSLEGTPTETLEPKSIITTGKWEYQKSGDSQLADGILNNPVPANLMIPLRLIDSSHELSPSLKARQIKLLIADDSLLTRKMVERVLRPFDMNIYHCSNGREAVDKVLQSLREDSPSITHDDSNHSFPLDSSIPPSCTPFDVVIIDYMMPGLDGAEAIGKMREGGFKGFICAVTGSSSAEDRERLYNNGASIIMGKPFNLKAFYNHMKAFFEK